ncbi:ATP-grasp domain-containing protein [Alteromonas sp. a30]|uniref:ATP-grasp domain-containing protein n=1 Tax=Alteromonas sp. a30 TaxID=2730917 RepID=UPI0022802DFA|nr:ATP-grasp domain-containing protein [Alteromonas sp. a30]MCY7294566.1 ATP-grasp domain-containing protein [Alteromonas sp. a30]
MKSPALIMLVHQARSHVYCGQVTQYCQSRGIKMLVISSNPLSEANLAKVQSYAEKTWVIDDDDLTAQNVQTAVDEAKAQYHVIASLATYEGYRVLMASINNSLSVQDANPDSLANCMDKYTCRKALYNAGLSSVDCHVITRENLPEIKSQTQEYFVKPRRGIGSFACFKLKDELKFETIEALQNEMQTDLRFKNIFNNQYDFLAEEFIQGEEYSFEVIVFDAQCTVVGTHAKYVSDLFGTTLETGNTLPAPNLSDDEQLSGEQFVANCLKTLLLDQGAYHIETRYDRASQTWNIIEINARMGGALINQSVEVFTGQYSFLELWVMSLIADTPEQRSAFQQTLSALQESLRRKEQTITKAAVFISQYGEPGRTISRLSTEGLHHQPDICEIAVEEGATLPESTRGIFILNALWEVDVNNINNALDSLYTMLEEELILEYKDA